MMRPNAQRAVFALCGWLILCAASPHVDAGRETMILLRALAYDRNLAARAGDVVTITVAAKGTDKTTADEVYDGFKKLESNTIQGKRFKVVKLSYEQPGEVDAALRKSGSNVVYFASCLDAGLGGFRDTARAQKILTMTSCATEVQKGLSLAVTVVDDQLAISLNLAASKSEGADFSSDFVRRAKIIE